MKPIDDLSHIPPTEAQRLNDLIQAGEDSPGTEDAFTVDELARMLPVIRRVLAAEKVLAPDVTPRYLFQLLAREAKKEVWQ